MNTQDTSQALDSPSMCAPIATSEMDEPSSISSMSPSELLDRYMGLVVEVTQEIYQRSSSETTFDDLRSYGVLGLLQAHRRFDPDREASFASFAYLRVRGAIVDGLRSQTWSRRHWTLDVEIRSESSELPCDGTDYSDVDSPLDRQTSTASSDDSSLTMLLTDRLDLDTLADTGERAPESALERRQQWSLLEEALETLSERQRRVVVEYYWHDRTLADIAETLDCSKSWACRIRDRGLENMRNELQHQGCELESAE